MRLRSTTAAASGSALEASADFSDNRIGAILMREGFIQPADIDAILDHLAVNGQRFGETAIAMGLISPEVMRFALARQRGAQLMMPGDERVDPLLVAAFEGDGAYLNNVRAIRSCLIRPVAGRDSRAVRSCAVIGLDCGEEVAVLAANLAIVVVRSQVPTLLVEANDDRPRLTRLFRLPADSGGPEARQTAVPQLWLKSAAEDGYGAGGLAEGRSVLERARGWNVPHGQVIALISVSGRSNVLSVAGTVRGVDGSLIVARKHVTLISDIQALIDGLDEGGVPIAGVVLV